MVYYPMGQQPAPSVYSPEMMKEKMMQVLVIAADEHMAAVRAAIESTTTRQLAPQMLVDAVLHKGTRLDAAILAARMHGNTPAEIAAVPGLHPAYAAELLRMTEGHTAL